MKIPKVNTLIFDLDGVIADTDKGRYIILRDVLQTYGIDIEKKNDVHDLAGISTLKFLKMNYPELSDFHDEIVAKRHKLYLSDLDKYCIPYTSSADVIKNLNLKYTLHIATTNDTDIANTLLTHLKIRQYFKNVFGRNITEDQIDNIKNYKSTLVELGINANECIVIEDSEIGIHAAKKEDIFCIGFNPELKNTIFNIADLTVKSFLELEEILMSN